MRRQLTYISLGLHDEFLWGELLWGVTWLHKATQNITNINYIRKNDMHFLANESSFEFGWDNKQEGVIVFLAKVIIYIKFCSKYLPIFVCKLKQLLHILLEGKLLKGVEKTR